ncbi:MAG: hypothetical protein LC775_03795, partial [Acidobacteria bacterium]|nr:hypothetical protein [Acidobacteriota bacterium]
MIPRRHGGQPGPYARTADVPNVSGRPVIPASLHPPERGLITAFWMQNAVKADAHERWTRMAECWARGLTTMR